MEQTMVQAQVQPQWQTAKSAFMNAGASIGTMGTAAPRQSLFGEIQAETGRAANRVRSLSAQAQSIADAVFGGDPETSTTDIGVALSTASAACDMELRELHYALDSLSQQIDRLTCL